MDSPGENLRRRHAAIVLSGVLLFAVSLIGSAFGIAYQAFAAVVLAAPVVAVVIVWVWLSDSVRRRRLGRRGALYLGRSTVLESEVTDLTSVPVTRSRLPARGMVTGFPTVDATGLRWDGSPGYWRGPTACVELPWTSLDAVFTQREFALLPFAIATFRTNLGQDFSILLFGRRRLESSLLPLGGFERMDANEGGGVRTYVQRH